VTQRDLKTHALFTSTSRWPNSLFVSSNEHAPVTCFYRPATRQRPASGAGDTITARDVEFPASAMGSPDTPSAMPSLSLRESGSRAVNWRAR
jgi:hypothetical protein